MQSESDGHVAVNKQLADAMQQPESSVLITVLKMMRERVLSEPNAQREYAFPASSTATITTMIMTMVTTMMSLGGCVDCVQAL